MSGYIPTEYPDVASVYRKNTLNNRLPLMADSKEQVLSNRRHSVDKTHSRRVFLSAVIVMLATFIAPSFQKILSASRAWGLLGWTESQWALFLAVRALIFVVFVLAAGIIGDFWGRRRVMLLLLAGFITCLVASMVLPANIVSVTLQTPLSILGIMIRALTVTIVLFAAHDKREQLQNLIIYSALVGAASILSPIVSVELLNVINFKLLYILPLLLTLVGFRMVSKNIQESRVTKGEYRNDGIALAAWTFGLCALIFSGILQSSLGWKHPIVLTGMVFGGGLLLGLNWLSAVSKSKPWQFRLYYQKQLGIAVLAGVVLNTALFAVLVQTYNFLYKVQDVPAVTAGLALAPFLIGVFLTGSLATRMNARVGVRDTLAAGLVVIALPAIGLYILDPGLSYWVIMPFLILLGFGFVLGNAPRLILLNTSVPSNLSATIQSIGSAISQLGGALAYPFVLILLESFAKNTYVKLLGDTGLSPEAISNRIAQIASNSESFPLVVPQDQSVQVLQSLDSFLKEAYVTGISQAMLVLAAICIFTAVVVHFSLDA